MMSREWVKDTREAWEKETNEALERAGREERVDHRSLAERSGDLERAAELSREPNVHLGPERYRTIQGGASETIKQAVRVGAMNAAEQGERDADAGQVERWEREIAALEARLKETYDRIRAAIDERIQQAGRAVRRGSKAASRASRALGRSGARIGRAIRAGGERVRQVAELDDRARRGSPKEGHSYYEVEKSAKPILEALRNKDGNVIYSDDTAIPFFDFISHQFFRTKRKRDAIVEAAKGILPAENVQRIRNLLCYCYATNTGGSLYCDRHEFEITFLDCQADSEFITGDQPVVNILGDKDGRPPEELAFYYPLSPNLAMILAPKSAKQLFFCNLTESDLRSDSPVV